MTTADEYVNSVLDWMPRAMPRRLQIGTELRSHIAERIAAGHSMDDVLRQLGDPAALAESYLAEVPLVPAPLGGRIAAKMVDILLIVFAFAVILIPFVGIASIYDQPQLIWLGILLCLIAGSVVAAFYTILTEWQFGQTIGKRMLGLRVVQESGARIGLGQSIVRQLPAFLQVYWIDAMFVLFTDKRQRAFEVLSKTRVVVGTGPQD